MKKHDVSKILQNETLFNEYMEKIQKSFVILDRTSLFKNDISYKDILNNDFLERNFASFFENNKNGSKFNNLVKEAQEKEFKSTFGIKFDTYLQNLNQSQSYKKGEISPIIELDLNISKNKDGIEDTIIALKEIIKNKSIEELDKFSGFINKQKILEKVENLRNEYMPENNPKSENKT